MGSACCVRHSANNSALTACTRHTGAQPVRASGATGPPVGIGSGSFERVSALTARNRGVGGVQAAFEVVRESSPVAGLGYRCALGLAFAALLQGSPVSMPAVA